MIKDSEYKKIFDGVLDEKTLKSLYNLSRKLKLDSISGFVKQGKESSVLLAEDENGSKIALKIYAIEASNFKRMQLYIKGDERFKNIRKNKRHLILAWCKKEYRNLKVLHKEGVRCPEPIIFKDNIVAMEFLGEDHKPSPRLSDVDLESPEQVINEIIEEMRKMHKAGLVHGDLSEYNILFHKGEPYIIDLSQGVILSHKESDNLLNRDIKNIINYAKNIGVELNHKEVYEKVTKDEDDS